MSVLACLLGGFRSQRRQHWRAAHMRHIVQLYFRLERLTLPARSHGGAH
jgi:hypothetical protein